MPNGAELFVRASVQLGIDTIFTLVGDHLNEVLAEAPRAGMRIIDMRHESGVTHAADAMARITRKPALAMVTGGPGHTNALTGIATAQLARSPLIAVSGARASGAADRQAFQDIDQVGMTRPVTKWSAQPPSAAQIPFYLGRAYQIANAGRKGAVHLTIPVDLFTAEAASAGPAMPVPQVLTTEASAGEVQTAIEILRAAKRPIVLAGSGCWWGDARSELLAFIELAGLPLYTITMARGLIPDEHPLCFGYGDPSLNRAALAAFQEADAFLIGGKRIDYRLALGGARLFPAGAKFIQIDIEPGEFGLNRQIDVPICADAKSALRALTAAVHGPLASPDWLERNRQLRQEWRSQLEQTAVDESEPLHPAAFYFELAKHLPGDLIYSWDGGDFVHWGRAILPARTPGDWLRLGPLGTIGSALPNAIAAKLAHPTRPVVLITGDGSLGFYIAELDTAVRHNLPFVIIVGNDAGWGLERELQGDVTGGGTVACELRATRYDEVMKSFGGDGETIARTQDVGPALRRAFASRVPYLLNVAIRPGARSPFTQWQAAGKKK